MGTFSELIASDDFKSKGLSDRKVDIGSFFDGLKGGEISDTDIELLRQSSLIGHEAGYRIKHGSGGSRREAYQKSFQASEDLVESILSAEPDGDRSAMVDQFRQGLEGVQEHYDLADRFDEEVKSRSRDAVNMESDRDDPSFFTKAAELVGIGREGSSNRNQNADFSFQGLKTHLQKRYPEISDAEVHGYIQSESEDDGAFNEPIRLSPDQSLTISGNGLLLPNNEALDMIANSGASRVEQEDMIDSLPARRTEYLKPMIEALENNPGLKEELLEGFEGATTEERIIASIIDRRDNIKGNSLKAGLMDFTNWASNALEEGQRQIGGPTKGIRKLLAPGATLPDALESSPEWKKRDEALKEFYEVIQNYEKDANNPSFSTRFQKVVAAGLASLPASLIPGGAAVKLAQGTKMAAAQIKLAGLAGSVAVPAGRAGADTYKDAKDQGKTDTQANVLAFLAVLSEAGPTLAFGGTGLEKVIIPGVTRAVTKVGLVNGIKRFATASGMEALEESATSIADLLLVQAELNPELTVGDALHQLGDAAIGGGVLGLAGGFAKNSPEAKEREEKARDAEKQGMPRTAESIRAGGDLNPQRKATEADAAVPPADEAEARAQGEPRVRPEGETGLATYGGDFVVKNMKETILRFESGEKTQMLNPRAISLAMKDPNYNVLPTGEILGLRHPETGVWSGKAPVAKEGLDTPVEGSGVVDSPLTPEETSELLEATTEAVGGTLTPEGAVDPSEATTEAVEGADPTLDADAKIREEIKTEEESFAFLDLDQNGKITETKMKPREAVKELEARDKVLQDLFNCLGS